MKIEVIYRFFYLILFFTLFSCSKNNNTYSTKIVNGIKVYKNSNIPFDNKLLITPKLLFSINGNAKENDIFNNASDFDIDNNGNIYILDPKTSSIKKFNQQGVFEKSIGRKGNGPGESVRPWDFSILNDTLYLSDPRRKKVITYSTNGKFTGDILVKKGFPASLKPTKSGFIYKFESYNRNSKPPMIYKNLVISDKKFKVLNTIKEYSDIYGKKKEKFNILDSEYPFVFNNIDNKLYVSENSDNKYCIEVYNIDGSLDKKVEKIYRKQKFDINEVKLLNMSFKYAPNSNMTFKKAINGLHIDKYNRLWVFSSQNDIENTTRIDIFKDGIYLNCIYLDIFKPIKYYKSNVQIMLKNERLFVLDVEECELKVYEY